MRSSPSPISFHRRQCGADVRGGGGSPSHAAPLFEGAGGKLGLSLRSGNAAKAREALEAIFHELSSVTPLPEPSYLISVYKEIASFVIRVLLEHAPQEEVAELERRLVLAQPESAALKDLQRQLTDICEQGCRMIENRRQSDSERTIEAAIRYIRSSLHTDLTLESCARHVHLSGNYFANLFKRVTGVTFVQFVTGERIEAAKRMLIEGKQVQEIADAVGYEDRRYFTSVFKKMTGMTPSEFRAQYVKE